MVLSALYCRTSIATYLVYLLDYIVERNNNNNNESNFGYFIENLITTNLFRMAGQACHTHQVIIASDIKA
jgi:uncharacterized protein YggL (DUF469 family)